MIHRKINSVMSVDMTRKCSLHCHFYGLDPCKVEIFLLEMRSIFLCFKVFLNISKTFINTVYDQMTSSITERTPKCPALKPFGSHAHEL